VVLSFVVDFVNWDGGVNDGRLDCLLLHDGLDCFVDVWKLSVCFGIRV
jgi:hypothetical protein